MTQIARNNRSNDTTYEVGEIISCVGSEWFGKIVEVAESGFVKLYKVQIDKSCWDLLDEKFITIPDWLVKPFNKS